VLLLFPYNLKSLLLLLSDKDVLATEIRKKYSKAVLFGMQELINPAIEPIVREFKAALQHLYGERLREVILFGSYARGDYDEESDIDLLVVLNDKEVNTINEVFKLSDLTLQFILQYGKAVSVLPVASQKYRSSLMPVYQNARLEGLHV
jgi:predicted nucleotidyltransferase